MATTVTDGKGKFSFPLVFIHILGAGGWSLLVPFDTTSDVVPTDVAPIRTRLYQEHGANRRGTNRVTLWT